MFGISERLEQLFMNAGGALLVLSLVNTLSKYLQILTNTCSRVVDAMRDGFGPQSYYCLESYTTPVKDTRVNTHSAGSAKCEWLYEVGSQRFIALGDYAVHANGGQRGRPLPILSMEIVDKDKTLYDLTEFLESVRVHGASSATMPSLQHIIGAWGITSGVVLNRKGEYVARMMTTDADIVDACPFDVRGLDVVLKKGVEAAAGAPEDAPSADAVAEEVPAATAVPDAAANVEPESDSDESLPPPPPPPRNSDADSKEE